MSWCACWWDKRPRHQWLSSPSPPPLYPPACLQCLPACCGGSLIIATAGHSSFVSHTLLHLAGGHRVCLAPHRPSLPGSSLSRQAELERRLFFYVEKCAHSPSHDLMVATCFLHFFLHHLYACSCCSLNFV